MIGRRRFLKVLGLGTAAGPIAAKAAIEDQAAALTSLRTIGPVAAGRFSGSPWPAEGFSDQNAETNMTRMADFVRTLGRLPAHIEKGARDRSRYVAHLDPDIAVKRSWSLAVKIQEQRSRNYDDIVEQYRSAGWYDRAQKKFAEAFGFRWMW